MLWKERSLFYFASICCCWQNQGISRCFFSISSLPYFWTPAGLFTAFKECSLSFQPLEQTKWIFVFSTTCANRVNLKRSLFLMILLIRHLLILYYTLALNSQISLRIETKSTWKTVLCSSLKERLCPTFISSLSRDYHLLLFSSVIKWFPVSPISGKPVKLALYKPFKLNQSWAQLDYTFTAAPPAFAL